MHSNHLIKSTFLSFKIKLRLTLTYPMRSLYKAYKYLLILALTTTLVNGQNNASQSEVDLKNKLQKETVDTTKINLFNQIASIYKYSNAKEGLQYANKALLLAKKKKWKKGIGEAYENLGISHQSLANYTDAHIYLQKALQINKELGNQEKIAATLKNIAQVYLTENKNEQAIFYLEKSLKINQLVNKKVLIIYNLNDIANAYYNLNDYKKAIDYYEQSLKINLEIKDPNGHAYCLSHIGDIYSKQKQYSKAVTYYWKAANEYDKNQTENINYAFKQLSNVYLLMAKSDPKNKEKYITLSDKVIKQISVKQDTNTQSVDALKESLKLVMEDTIKIGILNRISSSYFYTNPREGIIYGEKALRLATKINWKKGIAKANDNLGVCQWVLTDYEKAINCFNKSLSVHQELKDKNGVAETYNNLGLVLIEIKKYDLALSYFDKAFKINKEANNKILMVYNINNIALAYYTQKKYVKALEYYNQSKILNLSMQDLNGLAYSYSKIGKIYSDQKKYTESLNYLKKAIATYDRDQTYNIGNTYIEMGITSYKMAFEKPANKKQLLANSEQYLSNASQLFSDARIPDRLSVCYLELYKTTKEQGNYKLSLNYFEKHNVLKDSLFSTENENKLTNLKSKVEINLKDKQIEIQKLKIKTDSRKVFLLAIITFFVAISSILFLYLYITKRSTNKLLLDKNKEISNINKQKDKFFSIIAHDLRGPFSGFIGMTELLAEEIDHMEKEDIQFAAVNLRSSSYNLNRLLNNLLEWSKMEQGLIPFTPKKYNLLEIITECITTQQDVINKKKALIETSIDKSLEIYADHHLINSIIRNVLSNAIKFTPKEGTIKINAKEDNNHTLISIADNGIGMDNKILENLFQIDVKSNRKGTDDEPSSGLGLILCKEFIEKHGGKIWVESEMNKGSVFHLSFPRAVA